MDNTVGIRKEDDTFSKYAKTVVVKNADLSRFKTAVDDLLCVFMEKEGYAQSHLHIDGGIIAMLFLNAIAGSLALVLKLKWYPDTAAFVKWGCIVYFFVSFAYGCFYYLKNDIVYSGGKDKKFVVIKSKVVRPSTTYHVTIETKNGDLKYSRPMECWFHADGTVAQKDILKDFSSWINKT